MEAHTLLSISDHTSGGAFFSAQALRCKTWGLTCQLAAATVQGCGPRLRFEGQLSDFVAKTVRVYRTTASNSTMERQPKAVEIIRGLDLEADCIQESHLFPLPRSAIIHFYCTIHEGVQDGCIAMQQHGSLMLQAKYYLGFVRSCSNDRVRYSANKISTSDRHSIHVSIHRSVQDAQCKSGPCWVPDKSSRWEMKCRAFSPQHLQAARAFLGSHVSSCEHR